MTVLLTLAIAAPAVAVAAQQDDHAAGQSAWLGVGYDLRWVQEGERCEPQVLIERVVQGSPADRAGLRPGDAIVALNGRVLPAVRLQTIAARLAPGDSLRLQIDRDGQRRQVTAVADRRPARPPVLPDPGPARGGPRRPTSAPVAHLEGETLVLRNVERMRQGRRGYWLATGEGRAEYRRLGSRPRSGVDQRVVRLLRCAEELEWQADPAPPVHVRRVQQRADSLRAVITRRMLERRPPEPPSAARPPAPEPGTTILRLEEHLSARLRGIAGAELTALEPELAAYFRNAEEGLLVLRVGSGTPADRAGLRPGDVIVRGNHERLNSVADLGALLSSPDPQPLQLEVVRKGRLRSVTLQRP